MIKLYEKIHTFIVNGIAWLLDYGYVVFWQLYGFFVRTDSKLYQIQDKSHPSEKISIILIPGIYENWRFMKPIADILHKKGW